MPKHSLQIALENAVWPRCRSYMGRGMRHECLGVTTSLQVGDLIAAVLDNAPDRSLKDIADAFRSMHSDNVGAQVVFYFPTVDFCG